MAFETIKACARMFGMYRQARWIHRHLIHRDELRVFQDEVAFYADLLKPGSLCFDVGANYGTKSEVFLQLGAKVIAFEPQYDCIQELQARLCPHPHLVPINAAVGSSAGQMTLYVHRYRTCSSFVKDWQGEMAIERVEVPVSTLDNAIAKFGMPQYCKIDVEGYEFEVLNGLSIAIPLVSFEYHLQQDGVSRALACLNYLSRLGTLAVNITPAEKPVFAATQWWGKDEFIDFFSREVLQMPGYYYGDIFVKIQETSRATFALGDP
jgi:FkbM family methyltransferase